MTDISDDANADLSVDTFIARLHDRTEMSLTPLNTVNEPCATISEDHLHRPGLALAGYVDLFTYQRVQVLGNTETRYLKHLAPKERRAAFGNLTQFNIPCIICTADNTIGEDLVAMATEAQIPVFQTPTPTVDAMGTMRAMLVDQFAPQQAVHGSLVDVYGIGLLLSGPSGIGKSEVALDLIERGHRLVADDVVMVTRRDSSILMGAGTDLVQHFMEVRGLGLVDIRAMFGIRAIRFQKRVELVVQMEMADENTSYTRIDMIEGTREILGVELPRVRVPITPGKSVTVICEVIAMNYLLRHYGYDPKEVFQQRLRNQIQSGRKGPRRGIQYFEQDYE
ncbi:MAG: HPr(Ser) kinase/phosphatase [Longimonas sp.]|uniref:HPr(Ser) kinase/phosphatase n=1 Tax=Longimonas sp. TaxID=2039626 RepID=UPI00334C15A6